MKYSKLFTVGLLAIAPLAAQVNTEAIRVVNESKGWHGAIGGDLGLISGNSDLLTLNSSMRIDHRSDWGHNFIASQLGRGKSGDSEFSNKGFVHGRSVKSLNKQYFLEAFGQQEYDKSLNISNRQLIGGGVRIKWPLAKEDSTATRHLSLTNGFGLMWEREVTDSSGSIGEIDNRLLRSTNYLVLGYVIDDRLKLASTGYFQFDTARPGKDYRLLLDSSLLVSITKKISLAVTLSLRYDSEPPAGIEESLDVNITNGLAFSF